ncbi:hypothetical protein ACS0TY_005447 [Phlomoides rotata]
MDGVMICLLSLIHEVGSLDIGYTDNNQREKDVLRILWVPDRLRTPIHITAVKWLPPYPSWYKVNVDGSSLSSPGWIFSEGIFHNCKGFFVAAFTEAFGWGFPLEAELVATLLVIRHAHKNGWLNLWIESDSILVVRALKSSQSSISWRLRALWDFVVT